MTPVKREGTFSAATNVLLPSTSTASELCVCSLSIVYLFVCLFVVFSDPPVDPDKLPEGEWKCRKCRNANVSIYTVLPNTSGNRTYN